MRTPFQYGINKLCVLTKSFATQVKAPPVNIAYKNAKPFTNIPGPLKLEFVRNFLPGCKYHNIQPVDLHRSLLNDYGKIVRFPGFFGNKDIIFTYDPNDFETVFRSEGPWPYRRASSAFDYFRQNVRPEVYKNIGSLLQDQGEAWCHMRSVVNPIMLKPKTVETYIPAIDDVAKDFVTKVKAMRDKKQEMPANFRFELNKWALESIAVIALEHRLGVLTNDNDPESQKIVRSVEDVLLLSFKVELLPPIWNYVHTPMFTQLMDAFNTMTDITKKYVDNAIQRISKRNGDNMVQRAESVLGKLLKVNPDCAFVMAIDMLLAGIDTTSTVVANLLYHLAENPLKQEKIREEVMRILPEVHTKLTPESLNSVPYTQACLKETLRLTPVVPGNMRGTGKDLVLQGYQIPKNTDVAMGTAVLHLDEAQFENSKEFIPERWLSGNELDGCPNNGRSHHPFTFLPFGFGSRTCIGRRFAEMEATLVIFRILREFKVEWHYGPMKFVQAVVIAPSNDLKFKMIPLK